jgi:hypothetical protein
MHTNTHDDATDVWKCDTHDDATDVWKCDTHLSSMEMRYACATSTNRPWILDLDLTLRPS